ncbi:MAG: N-acetylglucosamine kinase [Actinobacteria bacterium]|jgi:N-acetylglucosamine kinase-like BadF-type ATPase|nr:N-acetylglucosamine kinase [Actinomycetota bacterium]
MVTGAAADSAAGAAADAVAVAVDGGGSKTDVLAVSMGGQVLASVQGPGSSPQAAGVAASIGTITALIAEAVARAGALPVTRIGVYLSGLDFPDEHTTFAATFRRATREAYPAAAVSIDNDLFALLRAGTRESDAVAVVCGTGMNCVGVRADGAQVRYPALGTLSGDWGGGWHLGEQALWHAARALDGRGPKTTLLQRIPAALGAPQLCDVIEALHVGRLESVRLADLSPVVFSAADDADAVALSLVDRQAAEIVALAVNTLRRLDLVQRPVPVVLGGGLIRAGHTRLMRSIERDLASAAPAARLTVVRRSPVFGAALLVLEAAGADDTALVRLGDSTQRVGSCDPAEPTDYAWAKGPVGSR